MMQDKGFETIDERSRLERLIALMPVGERRSLYETRLAELNAALPPIFDSPIASLRAQHKAAAVEWNRRFDQLETLDQHTPEFDSLFAEWEKVDDEYKGICDQIDLLEPAAHIRQSAPMPIAIIEGPESNAL